MQKLVNDRELRDTCYDPQFTSRISLSEIVSIVVSIRVDKFYDKKVVWDRGLADKDSESYQTLAYEANRAVSINKII